MHQKKNIYTHTLHDEDWLRAKYLHEIPCMPRCTSSASSSASPDTAESSLFVPGGTEHTFSTVQIQQVREKRNCYCKHSKRCPEPRAEWDARDPYRAFLRSSLTDSKQYQRF